jgi:hypothetical protein
MPKMEGEARLEFIGDGEKVGGIGSIGGGEVE